MVEDNGVGRAAAAELNLQQGRQHVSRGLQIVEERLQLLRISSPENGAIKTIDLFDLHGNATGTRVEVNLHSTGLNLPELHRLFFLKSCFVHSEQAFVHPTL
mgnify:CR=1 FL=1